MRYLKPYPSEGADPRYTAFLAFALSFSFYFSCNNGSDWDFWGYLSFGRIVWQEKMFPFVDIYSYVPTKNPWIYHEWLTGTIFYPLYAFVGDWSVQALKYIIVIITSWLIISAQKDENKLAATVVMLVIAPAFAFGYRPVRAQVFTYLFFPLLLWLLEKYQTTQNRKFLFPLPAIFLVWANLHGGFLIGYLLLGIYLIGELFLNGNHWKLLAYTVACILVTLINPYGVNYWIYLYEAVRLSRTYITEWQPIWSGNYNSMFVHFIWLCLCFLVILQKVKRIALIDALLILSTVILAAKHARHAIFFAFIFGFVMPKYINKYLTIRDQFNANIISSSDKFEQFIRHRLLGHKGLGKMLKLASFALIILSLWKSPFSLLVDYEVSDLEGSIGFPVGAIAYIENEKISGNILPSFEWGEYLMWKLSPQCKVGMDGRYETVYPDEYCLEYFKFIFGLPGWEDFLEKYPHQYILISSKHNNINDKLRQAKSWNLIFSDERTALFSRQ